MSNSDKIDDLTVIAGAGPAGLTAGYELLSRDGTRAAVIFEATDRIGGISQTVCHHGNRIDIGGHRFFSKNRRVTDFWEATMPAQGLPARDEILLGVPTLARPGGGGDPENEERVLLRRRRVSRIFYLRRFFDYPVSLKWQTFRNMGLARTFKAGMGYLAARVKKRPDDSLENFYINRFGRPLYGMFFEDYTEKVWGLHPSKLGADWGSQRVKGLSITVIIKDMLAKSFHRKRKRVETSLIEEFDYPRLGPGQMWETVAERFKSGGGRIEMERTVTGVNVDPATRSIVSVEVTDAAGNLSVRRCSRFISSMPLKDLVAAIKGIEVPEKVRMTASALPYRDFITVGLLLDKMKIKNTTKLKTYADRVPDTWIYIQERDVKIGRLQIFNNWSPYMVADYENTIWIGLEYFCTEGDAMWCMDDKEFIAMAIDELVSIDIIDRDAVLDAVRIKIKKAYPAYHGAYYDLPAVREFLDSIPNLYCVGRNGQHRYNNMDHSMLTAFEAVDAIDSGSDDKSRIWQVNTESEYHETTSEKQA